MKNLMQRSSPAPLSALLTATCVLSACSSTPKYDYEAPNVERALHSRVSEDRAVQRVRQLAALGTRMGGTDSGKRATSYLMRQFSAHGLVAEVVDDPELWAHEELFWKLTATTAQGEVLELQRAWPYGFSPASSGTADLSLDGSTPAVLVEQPPSSLSGDAEVYLVDGAATEGGEYAKVFHLEQREESRVPVFGLSTPEGQWLREHLAEGIRLEWELRATVERGTPQTVVAKIPPADPKARGYFLFCAHGDSDAGGPGANDNGSGEAIVLEIASAWATAIRSQSIALPPRELRFAIWGTEIHSTESYLERAREAGHEILGVLNYDQSGFGSTADLLFIEPDDLPANRAFVQVIVEVLEQYAGTPGFPERWVTNGSQGGTDSYIFSDDSQFQDKLRPAVTLYASAWDRPGKLQRTEGMPGESWNDGNEVHIDHDVYYHSAGDTPANTTDLEPFNMGWSARVGLLASLRWISRL